VIFFIATNPLSTSILYNVFKISLFVLGLFRKNEDKDLTKCKECGLELHDPDRLKRHLKKAHGNVPEKKMDGKGGFTEGGMW
jgi:hypothetical protein